MTEPEGEAEKTGGTRPKPVKPPIDSLILWLSITAIVVVVIGAAVGVLKLRETPDESPPDRYDLPAFVYDPAAPPGTPTAYTAAADYADDFSRIPCYCGCGRDPGHESLLDCFIAARNGEEIIFDSHGTG